MNRILLLVGLGLTLFCGGLFPNVSDAKTPPKVDKSFKFLEVELRVELKYGKRRRIRDKSFVVFRFREKTRQLKMQNGPVRLDLKISARPPSWLDLTGVVQFGSKFHPIRIRSERIIPGQDWNYISNTNHNGSGAKIRIQARLHKTYPRQSGKQARFKIRFKNLSLRRIFKRLSEFNNVRLSFDDNIKKKDGITIKLEANSRKALIDTVCKRYHLRCEIFSKVLWVKPAK